jgi:hypothetical protein
MSQPVKVSDALLLDARLMGEATQRSIAGQIEFWARLGRSLETLLRGDQMLALCKANKTKPLSECLKTVDQAEGHKRLSNYLQSLPFPHYEAVSGSRGLLVRIEATGKRTVGRFINRKFQPSKSARK